MRNGTAGQARILAALIALGVLFGTSFLCVKVLVGDLAPMQVVAGRLTLAAAGVLAVMAVRGSRPQLSGKLLISVNVLGVLDGVLPSLLIAAAETRIESGLASVLVSTMPLFTVFIAGAVLPDERLSSRKLAGLFVGFAGVIVLGGRDALDFGSEDSLGQLAVIGAACSLGAAGVFARILLKNGDPLELTGLKLAASAPIAIVLAVVINGVPESGSLSAGGIGALLLLGLVNTGPGRVLYFWIVQKSGSVSASLVTYIMPVAGLLLGWLVLGEHISAATVGGMALIMAGVVVVMFGESVRIPALAVRGWLRVAATVVRMVQ
jgi:drug/metabolite transporter (DMT)-like permease